MSSLGGGTVRAARVTRRLLGSALVVALVAGAGLLLYWQLPRPIDPHSAIGALWHEHQEELGPAWRLETCAGGVCAQEFRGGWIYSAASGRAHIVRNDDVGAAYREFGGVTVLGVPLAAESGPADRPWQPFVHAGIFARRGDAPVLVRGDFWRSWLRYADERGGLGFPRADAHKDRRNTPVQEFVNGVIYVRDGRPIPTIADIADAHRRTGGASGPLGYPRSTQRADGDRLVQEFQGGEIWWSAGTGAHAVADSFLQAYRDRGGARGPLGLPTGDEHDVDGGAMQAFQGGGLYRSADDGTIRATSAGEIQTRYEGLGGADGELGLPVGETVDVPGGRYQLFEGGVLLWREGTGVVRMDQGNFDVWTADPTRFGWPVKDGWADDRGTHQAWEKSETVRRDGRLYSVEPAPLTPTTAVLICDSQCTGDSWIDQGARGAGFDQIVKRGYPGAGYLAPSSALGTGVADGVVRNDVLLPDGAPGVIIVTLGGNDAARGESAAAVTAAMDQLVAVLRQAYPEAPIVIDGVISRRDAAHAARRAMDAVIIAEAQRLGCSAISVAGWVTDYSAPQADNVHLTPEGNAKIGPHYADALKSALGR